MQWGYHEGQPFMSMKNEHAQLRGMTRGPCRANQHGCKPTMRFMKNGENDDQFIHVYGECYGEDPHMISQKPVYLFLQSMHKTLQWA